VNGMGCPERPFRQLPHLPIPRHRS
jgi:hypothetical protein